ncbi:MAG: DNA-3-methyladenine glycosylase [Pseudanabaenaceae cyanobacterium SKYGB_i_bin29]|nr:DNA-3-methyladenine glycosylase [Pseudanabaenaceae cyanobacterium SKYG29]MDW8421079.1 DNA-3-methyladenine glycosylase [Pseudanabaenaceae cyanobacterium SKYGB_i_bin29]
MDEKITDFLCRPASVVAPELLGWRLGRAIGGEIYYGTIVEVEAYEANDPACHGYQKKTERNQAIFGVPGSVYVYLIYGIYHCLNIVTDQEGICSAVLVRAIALDRIPPWCQDDKPHRVGAGPGKLCRALKIDRALDGVLLHPDHHLWLEPPIKQVEIETIVQTTRIGITKGVDIPWRWYIANHRSVSKK